ncbi:hypothetical protein ONZ45_g6781 [Pleurotus djamor]|nr:hypothetical protein ONZ45_g6781 [Pleurotus djamor]
MLEDERVKAAIMMTLCELATAKHHAPPLECAPFAFFTPGAFTDAERDASQGSCVDALSRSAQFWSSYSGYLRDIPQLCNTFKTWNEIDVAREIYRNASLEKLQLLGDLRAREDRLSSSLECWNERIQEIQHLHGQMESLIRATDIASSHLTKHIERAFSHALDLFSANAQERQLGVNEVYTASIQRLERTADELSQRQMRLLEASIPEFERALVERLDSIFEFSFDRHAALNRRVDETGDQLVQLQSGLSDARTTVASVSTTANSILDAASASRAQIHIIQQHHTQVAHNIAVLSDAVDGLTSTASLGLNAINETAMRISDDIMNRRRDPHDSSSSSLHAYSKPVVQPQAIRLDGDSQDISRKLDLLALAQSAAAFSYPGSAV